MNSSLRSFRPLRRLSNLWVVFVLILLGVTVGLVLLSRHALQLQSRQVAAQGRESLQQNVRVALWRLDSRLAPFIATIHQLHTGDASQGDGLEFIQQRFQILRAPGKSSNQMVYESLGLPNKPTGFDPVNRQPQVEALLVAVAELVPDQSDPVSFETAGTAPKAVQSKTQQYSANDVPSQQRARKGIQQRAAVVQQQVQLNTIQQAELPMAGIKPEMLSVWIDGQLAVVRSRSNGLPGLTGVWVDWDALHQSLLADIDDVLPGATIRPVQQEEELDPEFALASLPAVIVPGSTAAPDRGWSPTHTALLFAWAAFVASAIIAAIALNRLLALSERRAAFVSAVTHELRTPLTTFRLYSDLLARDMVSDPDDRKSYLETLRREADRLTHLVENVLRYSRLERSSSPAELETVMVSDWIARITPRLRSRLAEADLELMVDQSSDGEWRTDPSAMEQVLFNLVDNAAKYVVGAKDPRVHLKVQVERREIVFSVTDHGAGVPEELRDSMFQPFSKSAERAAETASGVGLGLALVKRTMTALGGEISYQMSPDGGAQFLIRIPRSGSTGEKLSGLS